MSENTATSDQVELSLNYSPIDNKGKTAISVTHNGNAIACDELRLTNAKQRRLFAEQVVKKAPGISVEKVEAQLTQLAGELIEKADRASSNSTNDLPEIDATEIVRPERIIQPQLSAIALPCTVLSNDDLLVQHRWYIQWSDGRRELRPVTKRLDLPDGESLWIHPEPDAGSVSEPLQWSKQSRDDWLAGKAAPDPGETFKQICGQLGRFVYFPEEEAVGNTVTLALWIFHTYFYHAWPAVPYLSINGTVESGKTQVIDVLGRLVFRPLSTSNATAPVVFRTLHAKGGTLLLDEAEQLGNRKDPNAEQLLTTLLAGYRKGGKATRLEPLADGGYRPVEFSVFGPKALAGIKGLPTELASRCIPVRTFRAPTDASQLEAHFDENPDSWQDLRNQLHELALEYGTAALAWARRTDVVPGGIRGRSRQLWQPLLALAAWIESHGFEGLLQIAQQHALRMVEANRDEHFDERDLILLQALAEAWRCSEKPTPTDILAKAKQRAPELFDRWTARAVSAHLKHYGFQTKKSNGKKIYSGLAQKDFSKVQLSYHIDLGFSE